MANKNSTEPAIHLSNKVTMTTILSQRKAGPWKRNVEKNEGNAQHFMTGALAPVIEIFREQIRMTIPSNTSKELKYCLNQQQEIAAPCVSLASPTLSSIPFRLATAMAARTS